ncbi:MAG: hypothetical protein KF849_03975 [Rhizobiaceae bacterium]|nr:hypothetical protein [Rhizobiaceae bacterium]
MNPVLRTLLSAVLGFVLGLIVLPLVVFFGYVAIAELIDYRDFEGATGMGVLSLMPVVGLIGGAFGALWFGWRATRRRST